jgi:tetratricopeptide (TPR) repeat protein
VKRRSYLGKVFKASASSAAVLIALIFAAHAICRGESTPRSQSDPQKTDAAPSQSSQADSAQDPNKIQAYDPYHAMKAMDVGEFYLKKGDLDAALDRFQDAIQYKYDFARPRLLIAQIYEKKHDDAKAIRYYNEYLKVLPGAPDAKKVKERIEKLSRRVQAADGSRAQR